MKNTTVNIKAEVKVINKNEIQDNHIIVDVEQYNIQLEENEVVVVEVLVG